MSCSCQTLATTRRGRIVQHGANVPDHECSITFQFNNIMQWLPYEDLLNLEWVVRNLDTKSYFEQFPHEDRIHLKTASPHLFFGFLPDELLELRSLLGAAVAQLHWRKAISKSLN